MGYRIFNKKMNLIYYIFLINSVSLVNFRIIERFSSSYSIGKKLTLSYFFKILVEQMKFLVKIEKYGIYLKSLVCFLTVFFLKMNLISGCFINPVS